MAEAQPTPMVFRRPVVALVCLALFTLGCAAKPVLVDKDSSTGFALYRSGRLSEQELTALCRQGVEEIVVLEGNAEARECRWRDKICPALRVRYNQAQDARLPLSSEFLQAFDRWVEDGRRHGRKLAYRCRHGWHRAGRLSAYYRMRFQAWPPSAAITEMLSRGRYMSSYPELQPQVLSMAEWLAGQPCRQRQEHCLRDTSSPLSSGQAGDRAPAEFAADVCDVASITRGSP